MKSCVCGKLSMGVTIRTRTASAVEAIDNADNIEGCKATQRGVLILTTPRRNRWEMPTSDWNVLVVEANQFRQRDPEDTTLGNNQM